MRVRVATAALVSGAAVADAAGAHALAYYALVASVPAGAVAALLALGAILDRSAAEPVDRVLAVLSTLLLPFLLLATAVRAPLVLDARPPAVAVSALVCCLAVFALQALVLAASQLDVARPRQPARERAN